MNKTVSIHEVTDITPSYEDLCALFPDGTPLGSYDDDLYWEWIQSKKDVYFYERPKCSFNYNEAKSLAAKAGFKKLIVSNLS